MNRPATAVVGIVAAVPRVKINLDTLQTDGVVLGSHNSTLGGYTSKVACTQVLQTRFLVVNQPLGLMIREVTVHLAVTADTQVTHRFLLGLRVDIFVHTGHHLIVHPSGRSHHAEVLHVLAVEVANECAVMRGAVGYMFAVGREAYPEVTLIRSVRCEHGLLTDHLDYDLLITHKHVLCTQAQAQCQSQNKKNRFFHDMVKI